MCRCTMREKTITPGKQNTNESQLHRTLPKNVGNSKRYCYNQQKSNVESPVRALQHDQNSDDDSGLTDNEACEETNEFNETNVFMKDDEVSTDNSSGYEEEQSNKGKIIIKNHWYKKYEFSEKEAQHLRTHVRLEIYPRMKFYQDSVCASESNVMKRCMKMIKMTTTEERDLKISGIKAMVARTIQVKRNYSITRCQAVVKGNHIVLVV